MLYLIEKLHMPLGRNDCIGNRHRKSQHHEDVSFIETVLNMVNDFIFLNFGADLFTFNSICFC